MQYRKWWPRFLIALPFLPLQADLSLENTNIAIYDSIYDLQDYNRLRWQTFLEYRPDPAFSATMELDNRNAYGFRERDNQNETTLYRGYVEYAGAKHLWILGRQRIPFGVGRIWNPIDVYNPINTFSVEPYEREGVDALHWEYAPAALANLDLTLSEKKYAARFKTFYRLADLALIGIIDRKNDLDIAGWEVAGQLLDTGVELRSEGGLFRDRRRDKTYLDYIIGADYGFINSLTLLGEFHHNGGTGRDYMGGAMSYQPAMLYNLHLRGVISLEDSSFFLAPALEYSMSDDMVLEIGALLYEGETGEEFDLQPDQVYLRWFIHF